MQYGAQRLLVTLLVLSVILNHLPAGVALAAPPIPAVPQFITPESLLAGLPRPAADLPVPDPLAALLPRLTPPDGGNPALPGFWGGDGSWNKELLPHSGRHPDAYHEWILEKMREIDRLARRNREMFLRLFEERINRVVRQKPEMLYSEFWRNGGTP